LPYVEQDALGQLYRYDLSFFDPANGAAISVPLKVFISPAAPPGRIGQCVDNNGNPTGTLGAEGDSFAPNSVDAFW
jgi:hypothetical protein